MTWYCKRSSRAEAEADRESLEDALMDLVAALVKGFCDGAEPRHVIFVRPSEHINCAANSVYSGHAVLERNEHREPEYRTQSRTPLPFGSQS